MSIHSVVVRVLGVLALLVSLSAWSQPYQYHVYIDSDQRATTGCTVSGGGQTFEGADYRLTATVSGNPPVVTTRTLAACSGGSFGAGNVLAGSYPVGLNNGLPLAGGGVADVIELSVARAQLPGVQPLVLIGFGASSASGSVDVLYTANGQVSGPPMVVGFAALIPTLGFFGGLLLALALAALALRALKHNRRLAQMLLVGAFFSAGFAAWAANFIADGQVGDWSGSAPKGMDAIGDSVPNLSATDIVGAFAADENRNLYFRIDVVDAENRPPLAVGDAYTTLEDTALNIAAPGVLGNDSDPDGNPISAQLVTGPTRGTLALNANGSFVYTPSANANGSDSFTYNAFDGQVTSLSPATVTIAITPVNDVPVFNVGSPQTVLEDAGPQVVNPWATGIDDGDPEVAQTLSFEVTANSNAALFSAGPAVSPTGVLSYTPAANANGSATITLRLLDDGSGTPPNVNTSATQNFTITVTAVNDAPTFTASNPPTVLEDAGAQSIPNWATFNPGPPDEAGQTVLGYQVSAIGNAALFAVPPTVAANGALSYTPAANANGSSTFTVRVQDSGGTANGGVDLSAPQTFTISVTAINDAPSFVAGPNQTVNEDAGAQTVNPWATAVADGDPEVTQTLTFIVTANSNAALFSSGPAVSPTGVLSYTPAANANGSATITLRLEDNGSNTPPNVNTSATQTFTITVTPVNDAPSFVKGPDQVVNEDAPAQTVSPWATAISAGPPDETGQTLSFNVTGNSNAALFSAQPAVSPAGVLTYAPVANASGVATITLTLSDNGSNTPPNVNTSAAQTFTITVNAVNDAPVNTVPAAQTTGDGTPLVFSTANTNAISVADLDAGTGIIQMSFGTGAPANGTLTLANPGAVLTSLTGNGTELVIATGTLTALNTALNGPSGSLTYTPVAGTSAARTLTVISNDQGNTGSGGAQIATNTVTVNVDAAPVVSSTPANGETIANDAPITVNFNEPVNVIAGITLNCGSAIALGGTAGSGVTILNLSYAAPLPAGSCTLTVPAASVSDIDSIDPPNNPVANYVATFSVDAAPALTSSTPAAAAVVDTAQTVSFTYNEPVTDLGGAITLNCGGAIAGSIGGSGTPTLTFTPTNPLPAGASCTATAVAAQIGDADAFDPPQNPIANSTINFTVDAAPAFVSAAPAAAAVVGTGQTVSFTFDENVANLGTAITLNCGGAVAGAITGGGTPTLTFTPTNPLTAGASCTATAVAAQIGDSDAIDPPQNPVADVVRSFSVDVAPTVTTTNPTNGAVDVPLEGVVVFSFSEAVDFNASSFTYTCGAAVPFNVAGSGSNSATLTPTGLLPINTLCTVTALAAGISDTDVGDPPDNLAANFPISFTSVNDNPPSVTGAEVEIGNTFNALPLGGGLASDANTNIRLAFSEAVTVSGNWASLACASSGTQTVAAGLAVTDADPLFTLNPAIDLTPGESCTLTVFAAQVVDDDAIDPPDLMTTDFVASFTVDAAPSVSSVTPANGATGVAVNATITVDFSEPVTIGSAAAFSLECPAATPLGFTVTSPAVLPATASSFTLTPAGNLPGGTVCQLTVFAAAVSDGDPADPPDTMLADFTSTFTTVDTAPSVTSTNPASGATNVNPTSTISIDFSESVNFSTLANVANSSFDLECPAGTPANFTVTTASPANSVVINPDDNAIGGRTCALTVLASGITDADLADPPDTMAANFNASFSFGAIANDDAYTVTPHLTLVSPAGVRANDTPVTATITGFGNTLGTANGTVPNGTNSITAGGAGGRVVLNADGTFLFYPDATDDNTDGVVSFFYTITGGDTAQVTLTFEAEEFVWFADQFPPGGAVCTGTNTGTQACPAPDFVSSIAPNLTANDILFINTGTYQCGVTLPNNVQVTGNGSSSTLTALAAAHVSPITPVAGSNFAPYNALNGAAPVLNSPAGDCFLLNTNNTVRGLTVGNTPTGHAFQDNGGTIGTATIAEVSFTGSGGIFNLNNGGTINAAVGSMSCSSSPSAPILLTNMGGTITQTGGGTITHTGNFDLFDVNGGSVSASISTALNATGGNGSVLDVTNGHTGTLAFTGAISAAAPYNGDNLRFDNADGVYNFTGETDLLAGTAGVNIENGSGGSFTTTDNNSSIANINGISFRVNASAMTINTALDITHTAQANRGVQVIAGTGAINFTGTLQLGTVGSPMLSAEGVFLDDTGAANAITFSDLNIITGTGGGAGSQAFVSQTSGRIVVTTGSIDCNGNIGADNHCFDVSNTTSSGVTLASFLSDHDDAGENGGAIFLSNTPGTFSFINVPRMTGNNAAIIQATNFGTLNVGAASTGNMETSNRPVWNLENGAVNVNATLLRSTNSSTEGIRLVNTNGVGITTTGTINLDLSPTSVAGILLQNIAAGAYSFSPANTLTITDRANNGIRVANSGGTLGFGNTTINSSGLGTPAIRIDASSSAITFAQTNINMNGAGGNENFLIGAGPTADAYTPRDNAGDGDAIYVTGLTGSLTINGGSITQPGDDASISATPATSASVR
jgi:VCBS repeat-containing protein